MLKTDNLALSPRTLRSTRRVGVDSSTLTSKHLEFCQLHLTIGRYSLLLLVGERHFEGIHGTECDEQATARTQSLRFGARRTNRTRQSAEFFKIVMSSLRTFAGTEIPKFKSKRGTFQFRYSLTSLGSTSWLFLPSLQTNQISWKKKKFTRQKRLIIYPEAKL